MNLYPSILEGSVEEAQQEIVWASGINKVRTVQIDVIDGQFADNVTITPSDFPAIDFGELSVDVHLMTEEPLDYVFELIEFQEDLPIKSVIAQVERMSSQADFIDIVKKHNWQVGVSIDLFTPLDSVDEETWRRIDCIQLMSIEAGFQGQDFHDRVFEKIKEVNQLEKLYSRDWELLIDGGVKAEHVELLSAAGVEGIIVGSGLWQADDIEAAAEKYLAE